MDFDLELYQKTLDEFNSQLGIKIKWIKFEKKQNFQFCKNIHYEGRFDIDGELKKPQVLMDEILLEKDSTLSLEASLFQNPNLSGMRDYLLYFNFI